MSDIASSLPLEERAGVAETQLAPSAPPVEADVARAETVADERVAAVPSVASIAPVAPVSPRERIESIDVLRGVALLGILLININSFALPQAAYTDPSTYGGASGANFAVWFVNHVLFEGKMRAIFSMLFGASVIILTARGERRSGGGIEVADIYYRRTLWLIAIGVLHAYLLWFGDILFYYGVVGLALFPLRKLSARTLCAIGVMLLLVHAAQGVRNIVKFERASARIATYQASQRAGGAPLTAAEEAEIESARKQREFFKPTAALIEREIANARGGYLTTLRARIPVTISMQSDMFYRFLVWDVAGMLVLGMGLVKLGMFDASRSMRFYATVALIGYGVGIPLASALAWLWARSGFELGAMFRYITLPSDIVRFSIAAGHVAVVMMICKSGVLSGARHALAAVGRMALTNYLLASMLCTGFFYGYGLGMFARLDRAQLMWVVIAVWIVNLLLSVAWLKYFRFGPLEWAWRSLTYATVQPMRVMPERARTLSRVHS